LVHFRRHDLVFQQTPKRRTQLMERQRQVELAEQRGQAHIAQVFTS
jgi:hypothetical protein